MDHAESNNTVQTRLESEGGGGGGGQALPEWLELKINGLALSFIFTHAQHQCQEIKTSLLTSSNSTRSLINLRPSMSY